MKKVLYLLLASFLALSACGNDESDKEENKKATEKKEDKAEENKKNEKNTKDTNEAKKVDKVAKKAKETEVKQPKTMSKDEYKGVVRSYQSQIQLAGDDLQDLSSEINDSGKTTNRGKDLIYAIYTSLDSADLIIKGPKDDVTPPAEYEQDHQELLEANQHFQNAARALESFESSESTDDLNDALSELSIGVDDADINVKNILE